MRAGRQRRHDAMLEAALAAGHRVLVVNAQGMRLHRRHRSGLTVITPVPREPPRPPRYLVDELAELPPELWELLRST